MTEEFYEEARRDLLLAHDVLSGCHTKVEQAKSGDGGARDDGLSKVSWRIKSAMDNIAEALGVFEMWDRAQSDDLTDPPDVAHPLDPDDPLEES